MKKWKARAMKTNATSSPEAERLVIGACLTNDFNLRIICTSLVAQDFYYEIHSAIFSAILSLFNKGKNVDIGLVAEELEALGSLDKIGGVSYLVDCGNCAGSYVYPKDYCDLIKRKANRRRLVDMVGSYREKFLEGTEEDIGGLVDELQMELFKTNTISQKTSLVEFSDLVRECLDEHDKNRDNYLKTGEIIRGISTGFKSLDEITGGLVGSRLTILAARPAMGKTAFAVNIAENIAFGQNIPVGIFSLEMKGTEIVYRILASQTGIDSRKIQYGVTNEKELSALKKAAEKLTGAKIYVEQGKSGVLKMHELRTCVRKMVEQYGVKVVIVDYLQLLSAEKFSKSDNKVGEVSEISRQLKLVAKEFDVPVLCLSQLSRKVEERVGHIPMLSDLRDSGSIEQDADAVLFLHRRDYYDAFDKPGKCDVIIAKNRHGHTGLANLTFDQSTTKFKDVPPMIFDIKELNPGTR